MRLFVIFLISIVPSSMLLGQSLCPGSLSCPGAPTFCNVNSLNGFRCTNIVAPNPSFPTPDLCNGQGVAHNVSWWSFVGNNSQLNLEINYDIMVSCHNGTGIQAGILEGDCTGASILDCDANIPAKTRIVLSGYIESCNNYYLWIDGVNGDACDFTVSINAGPGGGSLPRPMPKPRLVGPACVCGEAEIEFPGYSGGCTGNISWKVNGQPVGALGDERIFVPIMDENPIQVCVKSVLGSLTTICDKDSTCITIFPDAIPRITGRKRVICNEDQPFFWNGMEIASSCISPPCTSRFELPAGCCIDSIVQFALRPLYPIKTKDVFICGSPPDVTPYRSEDGKAWLHDACEEQIDFSHPISGCDTSVYLNLRYFRYSKAPISLCPPCSGERALCPDIRYTPDCLEFDDQDTRIFLEWFSRPDSVIIDTLLGQECFDPDSTGEYCFNMFVAFRTDTCYIETVCIEYDTSKLKPPSIEKFSCDSNSLIFNLSDTTGLCALMWSSDQGDLQTSGFWDDTLQVTFNDSIPDSVSVSVILQSDCFTDTLQKRFNLVEELSEDTIILCTSEFPNAWGSIPIDSAGVYSKRSVANGCIVDSIRLYLEEDDSPIQIIDTVLCFFGNDTFFYQDPNGKIWKQNLQNQLIDVGGSSQCDSLIQLSLFYDEIDQLVAIDTIVCGWEGEDIKYVDPFGNEYNKSQDSILVFDAPGDCSQAFLLNLHVVVLDYDWEEDCSCDYECVKIDPNISTTDSSVHLSYAWTNSAGDTVSTGIPELLACQDDVYCLHVTMDNGVTGCHLNTICEPINESVLIPEAQLSLIKKDLKKRSFDLALEHNGIRTCELDWFLTFDGTIRFLNPQRTKVQVTANALVTGKQKVCSVHHFSCGKKDTLCQILRFKEGEIGLPR